jgi:hypothetical protein
MSIKEISIQKQENSTVKAQKNRPEQSGRFFKRVSQIME